MQIDIVYMQRALEDLLKKKNKFQNNPGDSWLNSETVRDEAPDVKRGRWVERAYLEGHRMYRVAAGRLKEFSMKRRKCVAWSETVK